MVSTAGPGRTGARALHRARTAAVVVRRAGSRGIGCGDVGDGQCPQGAGACRPLTFPFVLVTWLLLLATYAFAGLAGSDSLPAEDVIAPYEPFASAQLGVGDCPCRRPCSAFRRSSSRRSRRCGLTVPRWTRRQFRCSGRRGRRGRDHRSRHCAPVGCRKRPDHGRPAWLQPGADGGGAGHCLSPAGVARRGLRRSWHGLHRHCPGGVQRGACAARDPALTGPFVLVTWLFLLPRQQCRSRGAPKPRRIRWFGLLGRNGREGFAALAPCRPR